MDFKKLLECLLFQEDIIQFVYKEIYSKIKVKILGNMLFKCDV